MTIYYAIVFFIFGLVFGSFYNVVGYRLPKRESLVFPSSHCTVCNHKLGLLELFPVFSFIFLRGKCKWCGAKISWYYMIFELFTGFMFMFSFLLFGFTGECFLSLVLCSILDIIIISDYKYYIIPDQVIIAGFILLSIANFFIGAGRLDNLQVIDGIKYLCNTLIQGLIAFFIMYLIKIIGDFMFKKESMGGGDIKLMLLFGMTIGAPFAIISIFLASIIGLPVALILLKKSNDHIIAFGPFLSIAGLLLFFLSNILGFGWQDILFILVP